MERKSKFEDTIYKLGGDIYYNEHVDEESVGFLMKMIDPMVTKEDLDHTVPFKSNIFVNSPGGYVDPGLMYFDYIQRLKKKHTFTTVATGVVASMGTIMLLCGDKRLMTKNSQLLFHPISGGLSGTYDEIESQKKSLDIMNKQLQKIVMDVIGMDENTAKSLFKGENYLSSDEALELGIIHEVI